MRPCEGAHGRPTRSEVPQLSQLLIRWLAVIVSFGFATSTPPAKSVALTGRLVDAVCYKLDKANQGVSHKLPSGAESNCARECVRTGLPAALLTADGTLYLVSGALSTNYNATLLPYMGYAVTLTGEVTASGDSMLIAAQSLTLNGRLNKR